MLVPGNSDIRTSSLHDGISPLCNSSFRLTYERSKYEHCVGEVGGGGENLTVQPCCTCTVLNCIVHNAKQPSRKEGRKGKEKKKTSQDIVPVREILQRQHCCDKPFEKKTKVNIVTYNSQGPSTPNRLSSQAGTG